MQKFRINISEKVNRFLLDHHEMIGKSKVHVVSLSKHIFYKGTCSFDFADKERALVGAKIYEELQSRTASFLWRDHLPELAIKLLYGKFTLVGYSEIFLQFTLASINLVFVLFCGRKNKT